MTATFRSYVAIGDSFTEGLMDFAADPEHLDPAKHGFRGWADRLAEQLVTSPKGSPDLTYANLAVRGRLTEQVLTEQLPRALDLAPDLVSICTGGNDCLRPSTDVDDLANQVEASIVTLREAGITVLIANGFDTQTASPLLRAVRPRIATYNNHLWTIAQRHGCYMLDVWGLRDLYSSDMWAADRIHLSTTGHELVSRQALATLEGVTATRRGFSMPERPGRPVRQAVTEETTWVRTHLAPWVSRRLRGVSSGDGLVAKLPTLTRVSDGEPEPGER